MIKCLGGPNKNKLLLHRCSKPTQTVVLTDYPYINIWSMALNNMNECTDNALKIPSNIMTRDTVYRGDRGYMIVFQTRLDGDYISCWQVHV